jgi:hypothetical protein
MEELAEASQRMGLGGDVLFPGYVAEYELAALYQSCLALVFPSLYEGFGMPVLEAMAFGKPVACSDVASLPEIAGDAALQFDPRKPDAMADAIARVAFEPELRAQLIERGRKRLQHFASVDQLARTYLEQLQTLVRSEAPRLVNGVRGVYPDRWTGKRLLITYEPGSATRVLEIVLFAPQWIPSRSVKVTVAESASGHRWRHQLVRGQRLSLRYELSPSGGKLDFTFSPVFIPRSLRINADTRELSCRCERAQIVNGSSSSLELRDHLHATES